jgi:hemerythrin superfamily protein
VRFKLSHKQQRTPGALHWLYAHRPKETAMATKTSKTATKKTVGEAGKDTKAAAAATAMPSVASPTTQQSAGGAVEALKQDHRKVEQLFADYETAEDEDRKDGLLQQICAELIIHTKLEEELFYPACRAATSGEDILDEAQVEHDSAKLLIADLLEARATDRFRDAKVKVLSEQIKHHVAEEEKPDGGIFAQAEAQGVDTAELTQALKKRKEDLQGRAAELRPTRAVSLNFDYSDTEERMARNGNNERDRDERGRFVSDDDDRDERRSSGGGSRSRGRDDDDERGGRGRGWYGDSEGHAQAARRRSDDDDDRRGSRSRGRDDDDDRGGRGRGGWFGDSEGHAEAARRRWDEDDDRGGSRSRYRDDDDDRRGSRSRGRDDDDDRGGRGRGWYGDSEGHAEAARRRSDDDDDRRGSRSRGRDDDDDDDRGSRGRGRGWYGDPEGHAEAARRGREDDERGGSRSRSRDDDDNRRSGSRSRGGSDDSGHGGWFGDPRRHAQAARRGWENRR